MDVDDDGSDDVEDKQPIEQANIRPTETATEVPIPIAKTIKPEPQPTKPAPRSTATAKNSSYILLCVTILVSLGVCKLSV